MKYNIEFTKNLSTEEYNKYLEVGIASRKRYNKLIYRWKFIYNDK